MSFSPKVENVNHRRERAVVVVDGDQPVLIELHQIETNRVAQTLVLVSSFGGIQVNWNIKDSQIVPGSSMEQKNFLGVGHSQEGAVRVDAEALISVQSVPPNVEVDLKLL
jgi:hypothetical protein